MLICLTVLFLLPLPLSSLHAHLPTYRHHCIPVPQLYLVTRFLEFIQPDLGRLSLGGILADIRTSMMDEVDFTKVCLTRWLTACGLVCLGQRGEGALCVWGGEA